MAADWQPNCVTVFGGTGFLGAAIVRRLLAEGITVRVAVRHPDKVVVAPEGPQPADLQPVYADVCDETTVAQALEGSDAAVNAVGLYVEKGAETFEAVHELGALTVAQQAAARGLQRLVLISGIGADLHSEAGYVRARARGERLVRDAFAGATVLRPSVLFGPEDRFVNSLAEIAARLPLLPLFGRGDTKLQPVFVGDVAEAVSKSLQHPDAPGATYELGGPRVYSYRALIELILQQTQRRCLLLPLPFALWDFLALLSALLPTPPITRAQVTLMKQDNVVPDAALTLRDLGVEPTALEKVLPSYTF
ncbi:complex I NDUFA9 subunit family protein [Pelagibius sp.]|uniref:complex I NDUFA9 subunit family protein n=1 Tax=Pelagibius sp. TaxID=1931238 RepID=UPI00262F76DD|nr:complex I NDUFA9 subunit family protein [Pelagibius sp.]